MNREEILTKSRNENKEQDIFEKEVLKESGNAGAITAAILAAVFFLIQILVGGGINLGLWALVFSIEATVFTVKAVRMKRKHEIAIAAGYILLTLAMSIGYIYTLVTASPVM